MNPLLEAEQAVLGAVLLAPGQLRQLGWLAPEHFHRPVHQALFAAMRKLHADRHPASTAENSAPLSWVTDAVEEAGLHVRGLTASHAHALISACPRPGHAPVYGRMVLEGAIHRSVTAHAIRLHQAARADALQGEVEGALRCADVLRDVLNDLARRWGTEPRPVAPVTPSAPGPVTPPPSWASQVAEDEQILLGVLAERPTSMDEVVGWLRPDDFAAPARGEVYRCLGALHHRGEPIDRITLLWEAQRRGLLADGTLSSDQLAAICDGVGPGSAEWLGEQVMRSSVTRTAAASSRAIRALAENEALAPGRLINQALHALAPLDEVRTRWQSANDRPAPTPPAPSPNGPPSAQVHAALARSAPRPVSPPSAPPGSSPSPAAVRPPSRGHG
ncbi:DnaB-like helicase N-terminal domain-containing protein [Streptomyces nigrescens]|uniref:DnaB-like helicase N-terminal domain-containing protein n=1 Tax=Streptomyces nigrescens TaxID=1920 RepID=UPI0022584195|nr:DnaB-like helicase N-terminal domain-containing protein [Streptomyces libani]MCX5449864.1 helicase DnaB [Streptomyces libani]